jgi:hypothetical protein
MPPLHAQQQDIENCLFAKFVVILCSTTEEVKNASGDHDPVATARFVPAKCDWFAQLANYFP